MNDGNLRKMASDRAEAVSCGFERRRALLENVFSLQNPPFQPSLLAYPTAGVRIISSIKRKCNNGNVFSLSLFFNFFFFWICYLNSDLRER